VIQLHNQGPTGYQPRAGRRQASECAAWSRLGGGTYTTVCRGPPQAGSIEHSGGTQGAVEGKAEVGGGDATAHTAATHTGQSLGSPIKKSVGQDDRRVRRREAQTKVGVFQDDRKGGTTRRKHKGGTQGGGPRGKQRRPRQHSCGVAQCVPGEIEQCGQPQEHGECHARSETAARHRQHGAGGAHGGHTGKGHQCRQTPRNVLGRLCGS